MMRREVRQTGQNTYILTKMSYTVRCNCGKNLHFDEKPDYSPVLCNECREKADRFARKRKLVQKKLEDENTKGWNRSNKS